jgi:hypothetical protein
MRSFAALPSCVRAGRMTANCNDNGKRKMARPKPAAASKSLANSTAFEADPSLRFGMTSVYVLCHSRNLRSATGSAEPFR